MDRKQAAQKLVTKLQSAMNAAAIPTNYDIDSVFDELQPDAETICLAYAHCLAKNLPESLRLIFQTRLQLVLTQEHVAAQERMGRRLESLTWALLVLTAVLVVFGLAEYWSSSTCWVHRVLRWLARS